MIQGRKDLGSYYNWNIAQADHKLNTLFDKYKTYCKPAAKQVWVMQKMHHFFYGKHFYMENILY